MSKASSPHGDIVKPGTRNWGSVTGGNSVSTNIEKMPKDNNADMLALYQWYTF